MLMNMDAEDDPKSPGDVSGSEDSESSASSEDFGSPASMFVSFTNAEGKLLSVHRCVLGVTKDIHVGPEQLLSFICSLKKPPPTVVILAGGGYFSAAVFKGKKAITHKTFHRYTVRAKGGGAQSAHDARNKGHKAKSAGACLRRHNQAALMMDINRLLSKWKEHITEARWIFLRVPKADRSLFLGRDTPIAKEDPRVFDIPFATRRATFEEVQRVHATLFSLQVQDAPKQSVLEEELPISTMSIGEQKAQPKRKKRQEDFSGTAQEDIPEKSLRIPKKYDLKSQTQIPGPLEDKQEEEEEEKEETEAEEESYLELRDRARRAVAAKRRLAACKEAAGSDARF